MKKILLVLLALSINSCYVVSNTVSPIAPEISDDITKLDLETDEVKISKSNFYANLKQQDIVFTPTEIDIIRAYIKTVPIGKWGKSGDKTAKESLESNFNEYKSTFKDKVFETDFAYMEAAIKFAKANLKTASYYFDVTYYKKRNNILVIKWDILSKEFLVIHIDGRVSNYQITDDLGHSRYIIIPNDL